MGDKHRSEIQKPVKNTLLSGASHGFPFENFQGSSLLIPVAQDNPSALNDCADDGSKFGAKEVSNPENVLRLTEAVSTTNLDGTTKGDDSKNVKSTSQGYAGIFSSFFGGDSQKKQDTGNTGHNTSIRTEQSNSDQMSGSSFSSAASPPFAPTVQTFTPTLQVPTSAEEKTENERGAGTPFSVNNSFTQGQPPTGSAFGATPSVPSFFDTHQLNEAHSFFNADNVSRPFSESSSQASSSRIGFETLYHTVPESLPPNAALTKAQSAVDLIKRDSAEQSSENSQVLSPFQPFQSSASQLYQMRSGSADPITPVQPPPYGMSSPPPAGGPLAAPPMSSGIASRNYRRDHHKRPAYAPVPGLTSNTAISSSYLQPRENLSSSVSVSSSSGFLKQPLSGSFSQPALNISNVDSGSNVLMPSSSACTNSLQNFFTSPSGILSTKENETSTSSTGSLGVLTTLPSFDSHLDSGSVIKSCQGTSSTSFSNNISQPCNVPPPPPHHGPGSTYMISSHSVHPPIMSTKEQSVAASTPSEKSSPVIIPPSLNNLANLGTSGIIYRPVYHHWFIQLESKDSNEIWQPFSMSDSLALEQAFNSGSLTPDTVVPTDGGRYDVNVTNRLRYAVYWEEEPKPVRRCSWFYKSTTESRLHPYDENTAYNLEEEYKKCVTTNTWSRKVDLPSRDYVIMYGPNSMALFQSTPPTPEGWEAEPDYSQPTTHRPKIVKRGVLDDFDIDEGESSVVDHLVFIVHGIGSVCDFRFRTIEEAVDGFRAKSLQLIKSHFRGSVEGGLVNRIEVLPVSWHKQLHGETTGVDKKLQTITLKSIPRLRHFTNDTLLDILFYTSPVYCQNIVQQVGREVNTLFAKFKARNPSFKGGVSLVGHSLGSLILFDMLCHQKPPSPRMDNIAEESKTNIIQQDITTATSPDQKKRSLSRNVSYVIGHAGTGQPFIEYPQLSFQPLSFFALGSPIGMFVTVRGIDSLGLEFCLPTCSRFFNVFHPFDPVAYRVEALINPELAEKRPVLIPHHKGRKRMHLELKETMARVGADLKQRLVDSVRSTWNTVYQLTMFGRADDGLEQEVDKVIEKQLERQRTESVGNGVNESEETDFNAGRLNQGRRIDYVLQEAPLESFNEYVSAITSHVIYWDSEDTMLLILKEIYGSMGISSDNQQSGAMAMQENAGMTSSAVADPSNSSQGQPPYYGFK